MCLWLKKSLDHETMQCKQENKKIQLKFLQYSFCLKWFDQNSSKLRQVFNKNTKKNIVYTYMSLNICYPIYIK